MALFMLTKFILGFTSLMLFGHIQSAAINFTEQMNVYNKLCNHIFLRNRFASAQFKGVLRDSSVKLTDNQINNIVDLIFQYRVDLSGARMIVALSDFQNIDYNDRSIFEGVLPLSKATMIASQKPKKGFKLIDALLNSGARSNVEECYYNPKARSFNFWSLREFWFKMTTIELQEENYNLQKIFQETMGQSEKNCIPLQEKDWPISAQIYGRLLHASIFEPERSNLKTRKQLKEMKKNKDHICSCTYCKKPFT